MKSGALPAAGPTLAASKLKVMGFPVLVVFSLTSAVKGLRRGNLGMALQVFGTTNLLAS